MDKHKPLALVPLRDGKPDARAWSPVRFRQIFGGKKWSLALVSIDEARRSP